MTECKTITAREIKQIAATFEEKEKYIMWHGKRIKVKPLLMMEEVFELVSSIMKGCSRSSDNLIVVESVDFVSKVKMIEKYGGIKLPDDYKEQYKIIYGSDLVNLIFDSINQNQLSAIKNIIYAYTSIKI